jgi:hypothetical protein
MLGLQVCPAAFLPFAAKLHGQVCCESRHGSKHLAWILSSNPSNKPVWEVLTVFPFESRNWHSESGLSMMPTGFDLMPRWLQSSCSESLLYCWNVYFLSFCYCLKDSALKCLVYTYINLHTDGHCVFTSVCPVGSVTSAVSCFLLCSLAVPAVLSLPTLQLSRGWHVLPGDMSSCCKTGLWCTWQAACPMMGLGCRFVLGVGKGQDSPWGLQGTFGKGEWQLACLLTASFMCSSVDLCLATCG